MLCRRRTVSTASLLLDTHQPTASINLFYASFWSEEHGDRYVQTPVIPGHEFCGMIVETRREGFSIGENVIAEAVVACGDCLYCKKNLRWLCAPHDIFGFHTNAHGGLAEFMILPAKSIIYKFPTQLSVSQMVYTEPLSCAVHGVERAGIELGDTVVISGCGPIGLGMICAAKQRGPARIIALDIKEERLPLARECGADLVVNVDVDDAAKVIKQITGGYGCDVYLEAAGTPSSVTQGLRSVRKRGTFLEFGVFKSETTVDWSLISDELELDLKGAHCFGERGYEVAIDMLTKGLVPAEKIVSHSLELGDVVKGLGMVDSGNGSMKVTIDPSLGA